MSHSLALPRDNQTRSTSDEAMVVRAAQQDSAAFGPLYEKYRDRIYAYLRARTPGAEDAADLTQQVFLQALRALPRYQPHRGPFAPWLFRIARNAATDAHRRHKTTVGWDVLPEIAHLEAIDDADDPAARIVRQESLARLRTVLAACPPKTREVLALRFAAELTVPEIAATMGRSEAAVKKQLTRALRLLKEQYDEQAH